MTRGPSCGWAACALAVLLTGCHKPEEKPLPNATNAATQVAEPSKTAGIEGRMLPGSIATIEGEDEESVKAPRDGYLLRQVYKEGAMVAEGDVLFLLDPRTIHDGTVADGAAIVRVVSPRAGVPGAARHGPGDWVEIGTELTSVARIDIVSVGLVVPEARAQQLANFPNNGFELVLPDGSIYSERGSIICMPRDGTLYGIKIDFPNPRHVLKLGELVKVRSVTR